MYPQPFPTYTRSPWTFRIERLALQFWWVILFLLLCYMVYERATKKQSNEYATLKVQHEQLLVQRKEALANAINWSAKARSSRGDPAYIQLLLNEDLGLVPLGQTKIIVDAIP